MSEFPSATWRLVISSPADGAWNMALDEAILEAAGRGEVPPTLRLYAWQPPCLSLGYAQPAAEVDQGRLAALGWELVRRPTGGRAILHTDELTYSVAGPESEPRLAGGVLESYRTLSQALLMALHQLGLPAEAHAKSTPAAASANPVCFEVPSNYEITVGGKKLVGSAQRRAGRSVLQHGSLPLGGDLTRITWVLSFPNEAARQQAARRLLERAATVESILSVPVSWEAASQALRSAFQAALNLTLITSQPTAQELQRAEQLRAEKYAHPAWTFRV